MAGCSSKNIYSPKEIEKYLDYSSRLPSPIVESGLAGSTMKDGKIILETQGVTKEKILEGYELIGAGEDYVVGTSLDGEIVLKKRDGTTIVKQKLAVRGLSASFNGANLLAVLCGNNETVVIDVDKKKIVFKEKSKKTFTTTSDIASPLFTEELILFPTMDGKIVVVDTEKMEFVRDFIIGREQFFSNVIYLKKFQGFIIAATTDNVYSIADDDIFTLRRDIRFLICDEDSLFILTVDGDILLVNKKLEIQNSRKFSFARFVGVSQTSSQLIAVEHSGYAIVLDKSLEGYKVYAIPDDIDDYIFVDKKKIYYSRKTIKIDTAD